MDLALDNLQRLICHKPQPTNQLKAEIIDKQNDDCRTYLIWFLEKVFMHCHHGLFQAKDLQTLLQRMQVVFPNLKRIVSCLHPP